GAVLNPFIIAQAGVRNSSADYFTSYTGQSGISLQSLAGDINLNNNIGLIENIVSTCSNLSCTNPISVYSPPNGSAGIGNPILLALYPGNLNAYALSGNLYVNNNFSLSPAAGSSLNLAAYNNISLADGVSVTQLDVNQQQFLPVNQPVTDFSSGYSYLSNSSDNPYAHSAQPVHNADATPNRIIAAQGGIIGVGTDATLITAKATDISAGQNFSNLNLYLQNLNSPYQDVSSINVGGSLVYTAAPDPVSGSFSESVSAGIQIAGPGALNVWTGGGVDLGISGGVTSTGNIYNSALPAAGAGITVLAGQYAAQTAQPLTNYLQTYVLDTNGNNYQNSLLTQLQNSQSGAGGNQALTGALQNLINAIAAARLIQAQTDASGNNRLQAAIGVLFAQFQLAAVEANTSVGNAAYQIGYDAVNTLFPARPAADITLDFSQIQTLAGGDINLLAPGGNLNVGLAASDLAINKLASQLGIVAQGAGNVNILTNGNVQVNQSRIFTLDAGNITVWSSNGDIDAGRGAKSSLATPLPLASYDAYGNTTLIYPATVSGSGIRAQSGYDSNAIGNVSLSAPHGVVNADEAGIGGYDVTIAAAAIVGASNIQALGTTIGVPQAAVAIVIPDTASAAASMVGKLANSNLYEMENAANGAASSYGKMVILETQLLGFGTCSVSDVKHGKPGCGS
ncbi:MAG: filamentous hemagglutinin family protein, partial [Methylomonas sp.]